MRFLPSVIVTYNSSYHSQIKASPSDKILVNEYTKQVNIPFSNDVLDTWREGHPNFIPFRPKQKVIKKIHKNGNLVSHKLTKRFEGPFTVGRVHDNGVTYELLREESNEVIRAHYKQLRLWKEPAPFIKKYLSICTDMKEYNDSRFSLPSVTYKQGSDSSEDYSFEGFGLPPDSSDESSVGVGESETGESYDDAYEETSTEESNTSSSSESSSDVPLLL